MAKQTVNIGAVANDGTGDELRNAFDKLNDNFDEVYGNNFVTELMLNDNIVGADELKVTGDGTAGQILKSDGDGTFSWINNDEGDLTAIVAGTGLDGTDLSGPIPTINIEDGGVGTTQLADDGVTHNKLENRYTAAVTISTLQGPYSLDWSTGAVFVMSGSLTGAIEFDFTNFKAGQTIDIYNLTGAQTITFDSDAATSETFNKCGGVDYVGASTNLIQVQCVDDSATAVFNYAVSAYVSDTTPS